MSSSKAQVIGYQGMVDFGDPMVSGPLKDIRRHPDYESLVASIRAEGREEGKREESERSRKEMDALRGDLLDRMEALLGSLAQERSAFHRENREEILHLALAVARRVTAAEIEVDEEGLLRRLDESLELLGRESSYQLRLHPEDRQCLDQLSGRVEELFAGAPYRMVADPRVERGGLILEGVEGRIESLCGESLDRLEGQLIEWQRKGEEGHADDPV